MTNNLIYVYCLLDIDPGRAIVPGTHGLKSLALGDFYAIVKFVSEEEFSEENLKQNLNNIQWLETNAREHVAVITLLMEGHNAVIPFNFGTIFQSEESLNKFLTDYSESLTENFQHIGGKQEWAVKIYCDRKALSEKIDELSEEAAALETQIMASGPGKAFLLRRKKTELIDNELDRLCKLYGQKYYEEFRVFSDATHLSNLIPPDFNERQDTMILNAAFLIEKIKVADFLYTVEILRKKVINSGFVIETTGPWPPFSFIYIKEKRG
jgi:3-isopropylmalate dehydratase small subunit